MFSTETRNSSGDEIANMNFLDDDIVHAVQNIIIASCIISATNQRGYVLEHRFPNSVKYCSVTAITPFKVIQGH